MSDLGWLWVSFMLLCAAIVVLCWIASRGIDAFNWYQARRVRQARERLLRAIQELRP